MSEASRTDSSISATRNDGFRAAWASFCRYSTGADVKIVPSAAQVTFVQYGDLAEHERMRRSTQRNLGLGEAACQAGENGTLGCAKRRRRLPQLLTRAPRGKRPLTSGFSSAEPGGAKLAPGLRQRKVSSSSAGLPLGFARTCKTTSTMTASSSKRKTLATFSGELSMVPLPFSTVCVAEPVQDVVCADKLDSTPHVR